VDRQYLGGALLVVIATLGFAMTPLFVKVVYRANMDAVGIVFWRLLVGALLLWLLVLLTSSNRAGLRALPRRRVLALLGLGALFAVNTWAFFAALQWVPASLASLILYVYPALVAVLSLRWGRGLQGRRPWSALIVALVGVALTIGGVETRVEPIGIVLVLVAPCVYAVYILLSARFAGERRGITASDRVGPDGMVPPVVMMAVVLVGSSAVVTVIAIGAGEALLPWLVPSAAWPGLIGLACGTTLGMTAFYAGAARIGAAHASLVATLEPVWTISLAMILLGESLTPVQVLGSVFVLGGVLLAHTTPGAVVDAIQKKQ
jgi:drug/metabolite transporter (DMT)-like permease